MSLIDELHADLERERAKNRELQERLAGFEALEQELRGYINSVEGDGAWESLGGWDVLPDLIRRLWEHCEELERSLKSYREMFPCPVCGKPMEWHPDDNLGKALKEYINAKGWRHTACNSQQKR